MRDLPYYSGGKNARPDLHDGGLPHIAGVSAWQVLRANREHPELADGYGYTYNHAPMLTHFCGYFYLMYLGNPVSEHTGAGMSFISRSADGMNWEAPKVCFPAVTVPKGEYVCSDGEKVLVPEDRPACMHQRMAFYRTKGGRLLVTGFYGHTPAHYLVPWQKTGIGRVVREVYPDGSMGEIYFIRYLDYSGWTEDMLPFPYYKRSADAGFVAACDELLSDRLATQQWAEEHGDLDEHVTWKTGEAAENKLAAFCCYPLDSGDIIGLWKNGKVGRSRDGGITWDIKEEPSFVTSGAKSWGQRTSDGKYAIAYVNSISSEHRFPLVAVSSDDGIEFGSIGVVCGEVPPRRYRGIFKDFGPQYVRGIWGGDCPDGALWLCYSMNKEDIFVSRLPLPLKTAEERHIDDDFSAADGRNIPGWNIYSPLWAGVSAEDMPDGGKALCLRDKDPYDYAKAMRMFLPTEKASVEFAFMAGGEYSDALEVELQNDEGTVAARMYIKDGALYARHASAVMKLFSFGPRPAWHSVRISIDCTDNRYRVNMDGSDAFEGGRPMLANKTDNVSRVVFRTKPRRLEPTSEQTPDMMPTLDGAGEMQAERVYWIKYLKTAPLA